MNRRSLPVFFAVVLMIITAACSPALKNGESSTGNLDPKNPVTVTLWHYYVGENQKALEGAISDFNRTLGIEQGVIVEAVAMGSIAELEEQVTSSAMGVINARPMPQIFSSYPDKAAEIDGYDMLIDIGAHLSEEDKQQYIANFLEDGVFEGERLLVLPIVKSTELLYINATSWEEFAVQHNRTADSLSSWESLYAAARDYYVWSDEKTADVPWDGTALMGFDSVANYVIIANKQLGIDVIDAKDGTSGIVTLNHAALRRIFDIYYRGTSLGYFGAEGKFRSDDIKAGKMIAYVGSSSSAAYFPTWIEQDNTQSPIDFLALPYPTFEGGEPYAIQQGAGMCVAKSTPAQEEGAMLFLRWFTAARQNIRFAMTTGYLPVQKSAYELPEFSDALDSLRSGEQAQQNVAQVYEVALMQVTQFGTYTAKHFDGSYRARSILQSSLTDLALEGKQLAQPLKLAGASEEEILSQLDLDAQFSKWLQTIKQSLTDAGIEYVEL